MRDSHDFLAWQAAADEAIEIPNRHGYMKMLDRMINDCQVTDPILAKILQEASLAIGNEEDVTYF